MLLAAAELVDDALELGVNELLNVVQIALLVALLKWVRDGVNGHRTDV